MTSSVWARVAARSGIALCIVVSGQIVFAQHVELQSAVLGATGQVSGSSVTPFQYVGWRFEITTPLDVDHIGGHLEGDPYTPGPLFAALVRLDSIMSLPHGAPFTDDELLTTTTVLPSFPSDEVTVPMTAALQPGSYALVFGAGMYGATGVGGMPNFDDQPDIPPTDISSYIFWDLPRPNAPLEWRTNLNSHMRFVVDAHVPLPGDYNHDGNVDSQDYNVWRADFGSTANLAADGNANAAVDAADYTIWRDHLGTTVTGSAAQSGVPEPTTSSLLSIAALAAVFVATKTKHSREP
jgi:hypothetical protein